MSREDEPRLPLEEPVPDLGELRALLTEAGWRRAPSPSFLEEAASRLQQVARRPRETVVELLRARRKADEAARACRSAVEAAEKLRGILDGLLGAKPVLCKLMSLQVTPEGGTRALCRLSGQLRSLPLHPTLAPDALAGLQPWDFVCVHPEEAVVIGTCREPALRALAPGEVVDFKGWYERDLGLVRISRGEREEQVVTLAGELRESELEPRTRLVLQRDDPQWAIGVLPPATGESRFEVDIDRIETRLEDLAGLDEVVERLIEDVLLCLVHPDVREQFDLRPLRGMLLYSYRPGMGKTALMRALSTWLRELGNELGFDVALYVVKPNELKSMWHGGDAHLVRDELCGNLAARCDQPRQRPLFALVVLDEVEALGKRAGGDDSAAMVSPAQNDAVQALLAEMDGMIPLSRGCQGPPAHILWVGLTNRPDMLDEALKRPGRFGDLVLEIPGVTREAAEAILAIYAKSSSLPWYVDGSVRSGLEAEEVRRRFLRPALAQVFDAVVLRYATEGNGRPTDAGIEVTAGQLMAGVHYMEGLGAAKKRAARRQLTGGGVPAVAFEDVVEGLLDQACSAARQMQADRQMLARQLRVPGRIARVDPVAREELDQHRFVEPAGV